MADMAGEDERLYDACLRLWNNIVKQRMYVTGAIGYTAEGESGADGDSILRVV